MQPFDCILTSAHVHCKAKVASDSRFRDSGWSGATPTGAWRAIITIAAKWQARNTGKSDMNRMLVTVVSLLVLGCGGAMAAHAGGADQAAWDKQMEKIGALRAASC